MATIAKRIEAYNKNRNPELLKLKYKVLTESPFRFFRGTCHLFYEDLAKSNPMEDPTKTWICGDLHLENFGTFKGNNELVYFDLNDFDEAVLAPATWEIMRALTSIYLATPVLKKNASIVDKLANCFIDNYLTTILAGKPVVFERETTKGMIRTFISIAGKRKSQALLTERVEFNDTAHASLKMIKGKTLTIDKPTKTAIFLSVKKWCKHNNHIHWKVCDAAYRIAGTGSLGLNRYILLMYDTVCEKYFLLDMKCTLPSCLAPFVPVKQPVWANESERVITIQSHTQNVVPALLNTIYHDNTHYVIKRLQPTEDRINLALCKGKIKKLEDIIKIFAEISASAQLRSTGRQKSSSTDQLMDFFGKDTQIMKKALLSYSKQYATTVNRYYNDYCKKPL